MDGQAKNDDVPPEHEGGAGGDDETQRQTVEDAAPPAPAPSLELASAPEGHRTADAAPPAPPDEQSQSPAPAPMPAVAQPPDSPVPPSPYSPYPVAYPGGPYAPPSGWYPPYPGTYPAPPSSGYPAYPTYPGYPGYPTYPSYPTQPSAPYAPAAAAAYPQPPYTPTGYSPSGYAPTGYAPTGYAPPGYPQAAYGVPFQSGAYSASPPSAAAPTSQYPPPHMPQVTELGEPPSPRTPRRSPFARFGGSLPRGLGLGLSLGAAVIVGCTYLALVMVGRADWSQGALVAGIAALALGGVALLVLLLRLAGGWRVGQSIALSVLVVVILAGAGSTGIFTAPSLHRAQALHEEQSGQWAAALHEFTLAGESGSNATDLARVNDEWGEQLLRDHNYSGAIARLNIVVNTYQSTGTFLDRAYDDLFAAYSEWVQSNAADVPYADATGFFQVYRNRPQCDSSCAARVDGIAAQAKYQYGEQLANQGNYLEAATEFHFVETDYPQSPYAHLAHLAAAQAYLADAQQTQSGNCAEAASDYQIVAQQYADTPQAPAAKHALSAPVSVTGTLTNFPTNPLPTAYLSKSAYAPHGTNVPPSSFYFSDTYATSVDPHTGNFTFGSVKPGNYAVSTEITFADGGYNVSWWFFGSDNSSLFTQITPVCPNNLGTFDDSLQK